MRQNLRSNNTAAANKMRETVCACTLEHRFDIQELAMCDAVWVWSVGVAQHDKKGDCPI